MRDLLLLAVILPMVPFCFARPWIGVLVWSWLGYLNPHRYAWGIAWGFPFSMLVAMATLLGVFYLVVRGIIPRLPLTRETILLVMLWTMFLISSFFAYRQDWAWEEFSEISKILLMTFLTMLLIDDRRKLRFLLLVISLSLAYYGVKGGVFSLLGGGQSMVFGPDRSFIGDNTSLGLALNMVLPLLFYLGRAETDRRMKLLMRVAFALSAIAVLFTYSRGAYLGLAVVAGLIYLSLGLRLKIAIAIAALIAAPVVLSILPDQLIQRVDTLKTYEEDGSAQKRLTAWETAWQVALEHPFVGGGFQIIDDPVIYATFNPNATDEDVGVHSIYFEVLGENGFITFFIYIGLLISAVISLHRVRRLAKRYDVLEFAHYATALEVSIFGYAVSGAFLELASFDLFYHVLALVVVLKVLLRHHVEDVEAENRRPAAMLLGREPLAAGVE